MELHGSISILSLYDVCEEIRLKELTPFIQGKAVTPSFKHTAPEYVRFERPPVIEVIEPLVIQSGERFDASLQYYDYGVISLLLRFPFKCDWEGLQDLAARWVSSTTFDELSRRMVQQRVEAMRSALVRPYESWLDEDYSIFHVLSGPEMEPAAKIIAKHGQEIAQIVRGEAGTLSDSERAEVLQASMSYYPYDLTVVGWNAAFVLDTEQGVRRQDYCSNMRTRSYCSFAITTNCLPESCAKCIASSSAGPGSSRDGGCVLRRLDCARSISKSQN